MKSSVFEQPFFKQISSELKVLEKMVIKELKHYDPTLIEAATHLMKAGGKRLRPVMVLLTAQATAHDLTPEKSHQLLAMAVEILHTATLIHDDIIDDSSMRRGLPTVNQKWGLRTSVLTGDFLLARSCYLISMIENIRLNTIFSEMVMDMCNGEMAQLKRRYKSSLSYDEYLEQVRCKTALLMAIGCQGAAIINQADPSHEKALYDYGHNLGIGFQIMDDILDFSVSEGEMGKSVRNDLAQGQVTLPTYFALQNAQHADELKSLIDNKLALDSEQKRAFEIVVSSDALERSQQKARSYIKKALEALNILPETPASQALRDLAEFSIQRSE